MAKKTKPAEERRAGIAVQRIKPISFKIQENLFVNDPERVVKIQFQQRATFNDDLKLINFIMRIYCHYEGDPENHLVDMEVQNVYEIDGYEHFVTKDVEAFPFQFWVTIVSLSISHTRALMYQGLAGSVYDIMIPIVDPVEVTKFFFPAKYEDQKHLIAQSK